MDNKVYNTHYNNLFSVAEDGEILKPDGTKTYGRPVSKYDKHYRVKYKGKYYYTHILVAEVYLNNNQPIDRSKYYVHHINHNPEDNRASNLLIITPKAHSVYHNTGENNHFYGKHHTEETKQKMSEAHEGIKNPMYGKHHTAETKRKISEANKGKELGGDH